MFFQTHPEDQSFKQNIAVLRQESTKIRRIKDHSLHLNVVRNGRCVSMKGVKSVRLHWAGDLFCYTDETGEHRFPLDELTYVEFWFD
jgi:hypothetical protein